MDEKTEAVLRALVKAVMDLHRFIDDLQVSIDTIDLRGEAIAHVLGIEMSADEEETIEEVERSS